MLSGVATDILHVHGPKGADRVEDVGVDPRGQDFDHPVGVVVGYIGGTCCDSVGSDDGGGAGGDG
eukprot:515622-Hanusia_phi.AAC.2